MLDIKALLAKLLNEQKITVENTISNIIKVNSTNATISAASFHKRNGIAMLTVTWKNKSALSIGTNGNITDTTIGTVVEGKRPSAVTCAMPRYSNTTAGLLTYTLNTNGVLTLTAADRANAARSIPADTTLYAHFVYIVGE